MDEAKLTLSQPGFSTGRLAKDRSARSAQNNSLGVGEDGGDVETTYSGDMGQ